MTLDLPNFVILSENLGLPDSDVLSVEEEKRLLLEALKDSYQYLPVNLQIIGGQVTYVINHTRQPVTKYYMGWSAEDDTDYRLGDRAFFNPSLDVTDPKNGTIKVNLSQKFIKTIAIGQFLGKNDELVLLGMKLLARSIIAHELLHAFQYSTNPVRALSNPIPPSTDSRNNCPEGLCDLELLQETKRKIEYERVAVALQRSYVVPEAYEAFAKALEKYEGEVPEQFKKGAVWWLVSGKHETSVSQYYLRDYVRERRKGNQFSELLRIVYEGQYIPPMLVYEIKSLNDALERGDPFQAMDVRRQLDIILQQWRCFCETGSTVLKGRLMNPLPYLSLVNERFNRELERCKDLLNLRKVSQPEDL